MSCAENFELRDLELGDLPNLLELLKHLTDAPTLSMEKLTEIAEMRRKMGIVTKVFYSTSEGRVISCASLMIQPKFTRGGRAVGHIEDVVVDPAYRGKGLGKAIIESLCEISRARGCYKVILDTSESAVSFYEKLGFRMHERQMRLDL
ncbi:Acetyltransferase (GNAT) domain [Trypanosoma vivax]|uniref:Glucosamine 6-phosphate N-acetyltransferase n=1 Tax=Trypanosoma vivax (strain Y486) TaxID=1055687 RepID=G0UD13_TRYVY|nr:putative N-acetyltransferase [Trypanosoma vivax]KAH8609019.1 Acetyltransferase (GNAT) domain [Trypanosoma vivax]CCC53723.1 putative N-acetyltransferase [Trypanosoma vivax Y486]